MDYPLQRVDGEIPKPTIRSKAPPRPRKYPLDEMVVRDMFFAPGAHPATMMSHVRASRKRVGFTFKTRQIHMRLVDGKWKQCAATDADAKLGVAVYRTA